MTPLEHNMDYDTILIGAGPACLTAASTLVHNSGKRIAVLDAGRGLVDRACPGLKESTCTNCAADRCHVTMGLGGSSANFGNKHCHFPASSAVLDLVPAKFRKQVADILGKALSDDGVEIPSEHPLTELQPKKRYRSEIVFRREYMNLMSALIRSVQARADLHLESEIASVGQNSQGIFEITSTDGRAWRSNRLVLGVGRSGHQFMRKVLVGLGVDFEEPCADIGFRLEVPTEDINEAFLYQVDPKYKFAEAGLGSSRTFCTCIGGKIIPVKFGSGFYADGAFLNAPTKSTNIAFMARTLDPVPLAELEAWCARKNGSSGSTLKLASDIELSGNSASVNALMNVVGEQPRAAHKEILRLLLERTLGGASAPLLKPGRKVRANVFGPAIDAYWPVPRVLRNFQTECGGLSIIGDAAGASRGIVQAMASGAAWALAETGAMRANETASLRFEEAYL